MDDLKRCGKCVSTETTETIAFSKEGVCNICVQHDFKQTKVDWQQKKKELDQLIGEYRDKGDYDCLIPFSGGKDSTWTLYYLIKEYKLKPLVVRFDHGFLRDGVKDNTTRVLRKLGADFLHFTPNWKVVQRLMLQSFLDKGDFCWHCHTGIFAYPMQVAIKFKVPLLFWGEPSSEYTSYYCYEQPEEVDEKRFNRFVNLGINAKDMMIRLNGEVSERDLKPFSYPALKDLRAIKYRSVCLGSYLFWDVKKQSAIIQRELGWKGDEVENVPPEYQYEKIECAMQGVRDYIKYIKRGYARPSHLASIDIRNGRLSRDEALFMIKQYENRRPPSLDLFLKFIGLTEEQFMEIALSHGVSPYRHDAEKTKPGMKTHDFEKWEREGAMPEGVAERQLANWRKLEKKIA